MSFLHRLSVGHFDFGRVDAPEWLIVLRPLAVDITRELLERFADDGLVDGATFRGEAIEWKDGYITGPWWSLARMNGAFVAFALALHDRTGAVLVDARHRRGVAVDPLRAELLRAKDG